MFIYRPPEGLAPEIAKYLDTQLLEIRASIDAVRGVSIRDSIPEIAVEGRIYYLTKDLENVATEGYYVLINNVWNKITMEPVL